MDGTVAPARFRAGPANRMHYLITNRRGCETFPGAARALGAGKVMVFVSGWSQKRVFRSGESFPRH